MIKLTRSPKRDRDLSLDLLKSKILLKLYNQFDSFAIHTSSYPQEVMYIDLHGRWFIGLTDIEDCFCTSGNDPDYTGPEMLSAVILRSIYVMPIYRGKEMQKHVLEHIVGIAEETGEAIGTFCDPFEIITTNQAEPFVPSLAIVDLAKNGYKPLNDYYLLEKQRNAFFSAGFKNCMCLENTRTNPRQHFLYVPTTADPGAKLIQLALELDQVGEGVFQELGNAQCRRLA